MSTLYGERIARVEVEIQSLKSSFDDHKVATEEKFKEVNDKLDSLLALRNKGAGVFWLVSSLAGASVIGGATIFFKWLFGIHS